MNQIAIDFTAAREQGERAAEACTEKAERVSAFDVEGAKRFMLGYLARWGNQSGEQLTDALKAHGFQWHDARCTGTAFASLSRKGLIRCVGYGERAKGHGGAGLRIWSLAR